MFYRLKKTNQSKITLNIYFFLFYLSVTPSLYFIIDSFLLQDRPKPNRCLGVFGLSIHTTEDQIYDIFSKYGSLERVQVIVDAQVS